MDITVFDSSELPVVLRALRTAVSGAGPIDHDALAFLHAYQTIAGGDEPAADLTPVTPATVAQHVRRPHQRKRLVQLASVAALVARPVRGESVAFVQQLAHALQVREPVLGVLDALSRGRRLRARLLTMRRAFGAVVGEAYASEGVRGVLRFYGAMLFRLAVNTDRLSSYKRLGLLPEGTLGREYWRHMNERGFGFPGERGGIPQAVAYHDVGHVVTGYSTEPEGEIQQGAFQAGNRRRDGFAFLQFVLLQFHQGVQITPVAKPETGLFDPYRVLWAVYRGSRCHADITSKWDFWPLMDLPLAEARKRMGLLPAELQPGALHPRVELRASDAQDLGGARLVAAGLAQGFDDQTAFGFR